MLMVEVDVVEETKNKRPFRLQNQIKVTIENEIFKIFTCCLMPSRLGRERSCKERGGILLTGSTFLDICKYQSMLNSM